jgi:signal transduction histidine kinase
VRPTGFSINRLFSLLNQTFVMFRILGCITEEHDSRLVILAAIICAFGCYTALNLLARAHGGAKGPVGWRWLAAAAVVAGAAVWTTHFVAMLAYRPGLPIGYDLGLTTLSIVIAMLVTWIGFVITLRFNDPTAGGAIFGMAIGAMHYTGMAALNVPARPHWDAALVGLSLIIGVVFGAVGLRVFARGAKLVWQLAGTSCLTLAIAGLHFTAMTALTLEPDPTVSTMAGAVLAPEWLAVAVTAVMVAIVALGLAGSAIDQHLAQRAAAEAARLRAHVAELEATQRKLEEMTVNLEKAFEAAAAGSQAKSQFLATMSHELRTPLNAIIGFSEILSDELFGPLGNPRYKEYVQSVHESGRHLLRLINDILDLSKADAGRLELLEEEIDLRETIDSAIRMIRGQAKAAVVELHEETSAKLPRIIADQRRVLQVLLNLLSNAVKFTPAGGQITVSTSYAETGISVAVADTGIGISAENIPQAFERFGQIDSQLNRKFEGTGLGLPLSKRLMELHGGTLELESDVGIGTTVTVTFPIDHRVGDRKVA